MIRRRVVISPDLLFRGRHESTERLAEVGAQGHSMMLWSEEVVVGCVDGFA